MAENINRILSQGRLSWKMNTMEVIALLVQGEHGEDTGGGQTDSPQCPISKNFPVRYTEGIFGHSTLLVSCSSKPLVRCVNIYLC